MSLDAIIPTMEGLIKENAAIAEAVREVFRRTRTIADRMIGSGVSGPEGSPGTGQVAPHPPLLVQFARGQADITDYLSRIQDQLSRLEGVTMSVPAADHQYAQDKQLAARR